MESYTALRGLVFCLMISYAVSRPQYSYQVGSGGQNLAGPVNTVGSLPLSYSPGLAQSSNHHNGNLQILPSQPLSQAYLPPSAGQQIFKDVSQLPLQTQASFIPAYSGQTQNYQSGSTLQGQSQGLQAHAAHLHHQIGVPQRNTIITKDIYVHTAPPEADEEIDFKRQLESVPIRKNYRIVFIKAPTQNIRVAAEALKRAQAINEERTVIYVLSKKADIADLQKQISEVQGPQTINNKPEVFFIKYKTNEEAQRAQQEIQAQYDTLGGTTHISDEGYAPLTSVIGSLGRDNLSTSSSGQASSIIIPSRSYLPPVKV